MKSVGGREENLLRKARSIRAKRGRATLKNSPSPHAPHLLSPNLFNLGYVSCRRHGSCSLPGVPGSGKGCLFFVKAAWLAVGRYLFLSLKDGACAQRNVHSLPHVPFAHPALRPRHRKNVQSTSPAAPQMGVKGVCPLAGILKGQRPLSRRRHILPPPYIALNMAMRRSLVRICLKSGPRALVRGFSCTMEPW